MSNGDSPPAFTWLDHGLLYLAHLIQICAAVLIMLATARAAYRSLVVFFTEEKADKLASEIRLRMGRWLVLALEFQVAADILRTAVAPDWNEIGKLAAIIVLRTGLNYVLQKEIESVEAVEKPGEL